MITQRAILLGFVAFCFYLIAIVNGLAPFYYLLTWLSVGILVSSLGIALLSLIGLKCEWRVTQSHVTQAIETNLQESAATSEPAGEAGAVLLHGPRLEVELANHGSLSKTGVLIEVVLERVSSRPESDSARPDLTIAHAQENATELVKRRFLLEALPAGESLRTELVLHHLRRGRYNLRELRLIGSDVLGLFLITRRLIDKGRSAQEREILVGPATIAWGGSMQELFRQAAREGRGATRLRGQSNDVRATRPYAPGDDLRHVHWKTTARRRELVVKEYERAAELAPCLIIWDGAAYAHRGQNDFSTVEWSLRLAASLHRTLTGKGLRCGVLRLDSAPRLLRPGDLDAGDLRIGETRRVAVNGGLSTLDVTESSDKIPQSTLNDKSQADSSHLSLAGRVIELLADAAADRDHSLSEAMRPFWQSCPEGMDIYLLTPSLSPDVARVAHQLRLRSGRVTVGLINGSLFLSPQPVSFWNRVARDRQTNGANEYWPRVEMESDAANTQPTTFVMDTGNTNAGSAPVTEESYHTQLRRLQAQGVQTVLTPDRRAPVASVEEVAGANFAANAEAGDEDVAAVSSSALAISLRRLLSASVNTPAERSAPSQNKFLVK